MKLLIAVDGRPGELEFSEIDGALRFSYAPENGAAVTRDASLVRVEPGIYSLLTGGRSYEVRVAPAPEGYYVDIGGHRTVVQVRDPRAFTGAGAGSAGEGRQTVSAPMPGKVVRVMVREGDDVAAGAGLVIVEAMKMQNELKAPKAGRVVQLKAELGATVKLGEMLAVVE